MKDGGLVKVLKQWNTPNMTCTKRTYTDFSMLFYYDANRLHTKIRMTFTAPALMVDFASTQPFESGWDMYFYTVLMIWGQPVTGSYQVSFNHPVLHIVTLTLLFQQTQSMYLLREEFERLKSHVLHTLSILWGLKQIFTADKCYWNFIFTLNSDKDIFKKQKYKKIEYNKKIWWATLTVALLLINGLTLMRLSGYCFPKHYCVLSCGYTKNETQNKLCRLTSRT